MIAFFPSNAGNASSRWYVLSFNSAFLSSTTEGDIIRSLLPFESLLEALLQLFRSDRSFRRKHFWDSFRKQVCRLHPKQGRIQDFFSRGCTRLLLYCNTNKPQGFFFLQNTSCIRKPQVISRGLRTPCKIFPCKRQPSYNHGLFYIICLNVPRNLCTESLYQAFLQFVE